MMIQNNEELKELEESAMLMHSRIAIIKLVTRDTAWMFESISITLSQTCVVCKSFCLLIKKVESILKI